MVAMGDTSTVERSTTIAAPPMMGKNTLMTRIMGIFKSMDATVGPDFEKGLSRLKAVSEQ